MRERGLDALILRRFDNFAWITAGGRITGVRGLLMSESPLFSLLLMISGC